MGRKNKEVDPLEVPILWFVPSASGPIMARPGTPQENEDFAKSLVSKVFSLGDESA